MDPLTFEIIHKRLNGQQRMGQLISNFNSFCDPFHLSDIELQTKMKQFLRFCESGLTLEEWQQALMEHL